MSEPASILVDEIVNRIVGAKAIKIDTHRHAIIDGARVSIIGKATVPAPRTWHSRILGTARADGRGWYAHSLPV